MSFFILKILMICRYNFSKIKCTPTTYIVLCYIVKSVKKKEQNVVIKDIGI